MRRRDFLKLIVSGAAGLELDLDRLLWEPNKVTYFLPTERPWIYRPTTSQIVALELERILPKIQQLFEQDDLFYRAIRSREVEKISSRPMRVPLEQKRIFKGSDSW